MKGWT